jgi:hypothetical protein
LGEDFGLEVVPSVDLEVDLAGQGFAELTFAVVLSAGRIFAEAFAEVLDGVWLALKSRLARAFYDVDYDAVQDDDDAAVVAAVIAKRDPA